MSSKIRVLNEDTINKIAAGEVIENPSSVVKELAENSLDAGASEITIEIREGGRQLIRITDNGCGMSSDDALLCLERHATSKLKNVDDIEEIATMGFRGEAMPSIASISKLTLFSRPNNSDGADQPGTLVIVEGGKIIKCCPVECAKGTTIEVKSIFFNVPVRKKYQKSPSYDAAEICRIVTLLALANPEVKFQLISNQETLISAPVFPKATLQELLGERVHQILGADFSRGLCPLDSIEGQYALTGFLGLPTNSKHIRSGQYLFINRRAVTSPLINFAIREGYGTMLGTGRHPVYVLHLSMPGNLLDVNVHPQKREVRLRQEHALKLLIIRAVGRALQHSSLKAPNISLEPPIENRKVDSSPENQTALFQPVSSSAFGPPGFNFDVAQEVELQAPLHPWPILPIPVTDSKAVPNPKMPTSSCAIEDSNVLKHHFASELFTPALTTTSAMTVVATIPRYLVALPATNAHQDSPVLCLIDLRAAHSRIIYDQILHQKRSQLEMQSLLIPYVFDLGQAEAAFLRNNLETLQQAGLQIKEFGLRSFMLDALPQLFGNVDVPQLIEEILNHLRHFEMCGAIEIEFQKKIASAASRAAISGERTLNVLEGQALVDQLMSCSVKDYCPTGKPTMLSLTTRQVAALFRTCSKSSIG